MRRRARLIANELTRRDAPGARATRAGEEQEALAQNGRQSESNCGATVRQGGRHSTDIKYAAGGMLDVYFATRYLQLRDDVADEGEDRSTLATLERLEASGSLETDDYEALSRGYELLRSVDHQLRLIVGKVAAVPSTDYPAFREIAKRLGFRECRATE